MRECVNVYVRVYDCVSVCVLVCVWQETCSRCLYTCADMRDLFWHDFELDDPAQRARHKKKKTATKGNLSELSLPAPGSAAPLAAGLGPEAVDLVAQRRQEKKEKQVIKRNKSFGRAAVSRGLKELAAEVQEAKEAREGPTLTTGPVEAVESDSVRGGLVPDVHHLLVNYRTQARILAIAALVVRLLTRYFPQAIDKLQPERSVVQGKKPVFWCTKPQAQEDLSDSAYLHLFGQGRSSSFIEFGAEQVRDGRGEGEKARVAGLSRKGTTDRQA